jgi:hypothetical protein
MVFFLALLPEEDQNAFFEWAKNHLATQSEPFRARFSPVLQGLITGANGKTEQAQGSGCFLGWSNATHWLLADG